MRRLFAVLLFALALLPLRADDARSRYIAKYKDIAVEQMLSSGVPASITLAQGCLESGNGTSKLATQANNHFGIKCRGWNGPSILHDDDLKGECFRSYSSAEQSFQDHSDFLRYNDRYGFLFDLDPEDYKAWARGLKKAGYATDPAYPEKLIKIIEDYELYRYDKVSSATSDGRREALSLPPSPSRLERSSEVEAPLHFKPRSVGSVTIDYTFYERHGVLYIVANGTETYASLARQFNLFRREIMRYNDVKRDGVIPAGKIVYLQAKRNQSTKDLAKHVVAEGETMASISQRFAVKLKNLYKFNNMKPGSEPAPGSIISLRKEKK